MELQTIWTDPLIWGQPKLYGVAELPSPSKKKRKKRKISLASARRGRMKSVEKAKHKSG